MPKSVHRTSFQSSLQPIPEADQANHSRRESYPLQDLSKSRQKKESEEDREDDHIHTFNPSDGGDAQDRDNGTLPGGKKVGFGLVRWWKGNIARVLPVRDDVRDHFGGLVNFLRWRCIFVSLIFEFRILPLFSFLWRWYIEAANFAILWNMRV